MIPVSAWVYGFGSQAFLTFVECARGNNWRDPWYLSALSIDAGLTFVGYYSIMIPTVEALCRELGLAGVSWYVAHVIWAFLSVIVARRVEKILLED